MSPVRLGNVDYSDDSNDDESSSGDEVSIDGSSDDEDESIEESDGDVIDEDDSLLADETEEDEAVEEAGDEESDEDFLFDMDADDEAQSGLDQVAEAGNEAVEDTLMGGGWTRIDNNDRTALGSMLLDMVQPRNSGRQHHLASGGLMDAADMMRNILRGDMGIEGLAEFEDSLGIRFVRADRGNGRISSVGLSAGLTNRAGSNNVLAGSVRPTVHQIINSGTLLSSRQHAEMR
jgi:hypothetical protein